MKRILGTIQNEVNEVIEELGMFGYSAEDLPEDVSIQEYVVANSNGNNYDMFKVVNDLVECIENNTIMIGR